MHPSVGPIEEAALIDAFFTAIGGGSAAERVMELNWRQTGLLSVERPPPLITPASKILHLHHSIR